MQIRTGLGYDVHRLEPGMPFMLGGIKIPYSKGAIGHSDADVLIHAICDALLGAANLRDIGFHFPNIDPSYKGIDSALLLEKVTELLKQKGYSIGNIDATIVLEKPKLATFIPQMISRLTQIMEIGEERVSVKATTTEKLGFEGREEGVTAHAVALIIKIE